MDVEPHSSSPGTHEERERELGVLFGGGTGWSTDTKRRERMGACEVYPTKGEGKNDGSDGRQTRDACTTIHSMSVDRTTKTKQNKTKNEHKKRSYGGERRREEPERDGRGGRKQGGVVKIRAQGISWRRRSRRRRRVVECGRKFVDLVLIIALVVESSDEWVGGGGLRSSGGQVLEGMSFRGGRFAGLVGRMMGVRVEEDGDAFGETGGPAERAAARHRRALSPMVMVAERAAERELQIAQPEDRKSVV